MAGEATALTAALMVQGCGSDVGKSTLVAGLCRLFADRGLRVRPFKPQNMSNNAAVTADGGEIGRAQALQALACRTPPTVHMNPVLLKPETNVGAQLIVQGRMQGSWRAAALQEKKPELLDAVLDSYRRLCAEADLVLVEGAGSPAETNLRARDIANMGFARAAGTPVVLVGDIDRGHVIAALVGAHAVLDHADRDMIQGFIINKFRGDPALFDAGRAEIVRRTGWCDLGMAHWVAAAHRLPAEDAVVLGGGGGGARLEATGRRPKVRTPLLPSIANFDDLDPLRREPGVDFAFLPPGRALPGDVDLVVLAGAKSTLSDLAALRSQGWDVDLHAHARRGGRIIGLCGGYQMLGRSIADPLGLEGPAGTAEGLGLLDVETVLDDAKTLRRVEGQLVTTAAPFAGYEIHLGRTAGPACARPLLLMADGRFDGAVSPEGRIAGAYVHGLFDRAEIRSDLLGTALTDRPDQAQALDADLDALASVLDRSLDFEAIARTAGL